MGPTASRLWDGALVCRVANLWDTPVVMSGQNIGVWLNDENKKIAYDGFYSVKLIGTRDKSFSKNDLKCAGIEGNHIFHTCDDALFIKASDTAVVNYILKKIGISKPNVPYITLSFHLEYGIKDVVYKIRECSDLPIVIIPTCPPDRMHQKSVHSKLVKEGVEDIYIVEKLHSHSEIKGVISNAYACISTRHHPIIFALGSGVPCLSINVTKYFSNKNHGALDLCGISEMSFDAIDMNIDTEKSPELSNKIKLLFEKNKELSDRIFASHPIIREAKSVFLEKVKHIYMGVQ